MIGTGLLTGIKLFLWMLLLIVPGLYKALTYSQSVHISQYEKISGGDANRLSQTLVKEAGILRTLGNYMVLVFLMYLSFIILYLLILVWFIPTSFTISQDPSHTLPLVPVIAGFLAVLAAVVWYSLVMIFMMCFGNFQYLIFREENKVAFQKAVKELKSING